MRITRDSNITKLFAFTIVLLFLLSTSAQITGSMVESTLDRDLYEEAVGDSVSPFDPRIGYREAEEVDDTVVPKIFNHPELGESIVRTNLPDYILETNDIKLDGPYTAAEDYPSFSNLDLGGTHVSVDYLDPGDPGGGEYAYGVVIVPNVWSIGLMVTVNFELHNVQSHSISVTCTFKGKEGTYEEWSVSGSTTVGIFSTKTFSLTKTIPNTSVGLKSGTATITGGITLTKNYDKTFVQKFGIIPTPPTDPMTTTSGSSAYFWEGCSNDGFAWSSSYKIFHPEDWSVRYKAATWLDKTSSSVTSVYDISKELNTEVHDHMTYDGNYQYALDCVFSDTYIMSTSNYHGVCDEFSVMTASMSRSMGIPARYLLVYCPDFAHALNEVWVSKDGTWTWVLSDSTWEWFDRADDEELSKVKIYAGFDDSRTYSSTADGSSTNGRIEWYSSDCRYSAYYDGPNDYFDLHLACDSIQLWYNSTSYFETLRTRDGSTPLKVGTNFWGNKYFYCDTIASTSDYKHGPMFYFNYFNPFKLKNLVQFKVDLALDHTSDKMGDLIVSLYDSNRDLIESFVLYDSWYSTESRAYFNYQYDNGVIDNILDSTHYGDWRNDWKFWYDSGSSQVKSQLGSGTIHVHDTTTINSDRVVQYIGIQFARASTYNFHGSNLRVYNMILDWKV